jgi:hypothetical protein
MNRNDHGDELAPDPLDGWELVGHSVPDGAVLGPRVLMKRGDEVLVVDLVAKRAFPPTGIRHARGDWYTVPDEAVSATIAEARRAAFYQSIGEYLRSRSTVVDGGEIVQDRIAEVARPDTVASLAAQDLEMKNAASAVSLAHEENPNVREDVAAVMDALRSEVKHLRVVIYWSSKSQAARVLHRLFRWSSRGKSNWHGPRLPLPPLLGDGDTAYILSLDGYAESAWNAFARPRRKEIAAELVVRQQVHRDGAELIVKSVQHRSSRRLATQLSAHFVYFSGETDPQVLPRDMWLNRTATIVVTTRGRYTISLLRALADRVNIDDDLPVFLSDGLSTNLWRAFTRSPSPSDLASCVGGMTADLMRQGREKERVAREVLRFLSAAFTCTSDRQFWSDLVSDGHFTAAARELALPVSSEDLRRELHQLALS